MDTEYIRFFTEETMVMQSLKLIAGLTLLALSVLLFMEAQTAGERPKKQYIKISELGSSPMYQGFSTPTFAATQVVALVDLPRLCYGAKVHLARRLMTVASTGSQRNSITAWCIPKNIWYVAEIIYPEPPKVVGYIWLFRVDSKGVYYEPVQIIETHFRFLSEWFFGIGTCFLIWFWYTTKTSAWRPV